MNPKILKLREELGKNKAKISELQARNRDLDRQLRELENTEIVGMVRAQGMTLEQFTELMHKLNPPVTTMKKEDPSHEET